MSQAPEDQVGRQLDDAVVLELARELDRAEASQGPLRHFSLKHPAMTIADAYAIQRAWVDMNVAAGRVIAGRKVGLTSRAMQVVAGIDEPDYGVLFADMFCQDGGVVPVSDLIAPRVEVELAFHLHAPLQGPNVTIFDALAATAFVAPALEIIDTRFHRFDPDTQSPRSITDTIADNAASARLVVGGTPVPPTSVDLRWVGATLVVNGVIETSGVAAAVLNRPANGVVWLANKLAAHGESLAAGDVVLSGSFTPSVPVAHGDYCVAEFGSLGSVSCRFD